MIFTLVGMPASGKSCMGKAIASKLKMKFLDFMVLPESRRGAVASSRELWGGAFFPGSFRFTTVQKPVSLPAKQTLLRSLVPQCPPVGN